jgi:triphosphoribosyl-dephospho-CoA synthetase
MAYGHAERTLATIRLLEAETRELLARQEHLDPEQAEWLCQAAESASRRLRADRTARLTHDQAGAW